MSLQFDYPALAALSAVLRSGSFERAAAELGVTPPAISQRIRSLEERQGAVLVLRGQPCSGTPLGLRLARHFAEVALLESAVTDEIGAPVNATRPTVRVAVTADSLATWVVPALASVQGMLFDLVVDDQDHSAEWLRRGEVTAAVTSHPRAIQGCDVRTLGPLRYLATASPDFAARHFSDGPTAEALSQAPALVFSQKDRIQHQWAARMAGRAIALPAHFLPSSMAFVDATLLGMGWGLNPEPLVRDHLAAGRLVALSEDTFDTPLYWQTSRLASAALRPLTLAISTASSRIANRISP